MPQLLDALIPRRGMKAVTGPGVVSMMYDVPIWERVRNDEKFFRDAMALYHTNRWIRKAEMTIAQRVSTTPWHLEDDNGDEVDDTASPQFKAIQALLEKPNPMTTWSTLTKLTLRHSGLCGSAFWYLDEIDKLIGWPTAIYYIRPDRMTPLEDEGRLVAWELDQRNQTPGSGMRLELNEILHFQLDPPDKGHFGIGLVESAMTSAQKLALVDRYGIDVLSSGGRRAGMYAPKSGETVTDEVYDRLVKDLRTINELPDAAKRSLVARAPVDWTPTSGDPTSLSVIDFATNTRDDILVHWGVPYSTIGGATASGLNSGESRKYDEAALWQNAAGPRATGIVETIQFQLLDRLQATGQNIQFVLEVPEFDDRTPQFALAQAAENLPLRNWERRELVGLDPFGDPLLDNAVWVPFGITEKAIAPDENGNPVAQPEPEPPPEPIIVPPQDQLVPAKAQIPGVDKLRDAMAASIKKDVQKVLSEMGAEVARRVRSRHDALVKNPKNVGAAFDESRWQAALTKAMRPHVVQIAESTSGRVTAAFGRKAGLSDNVLARLLAKVGVRVKDITDYTRERIRDLVKQGIEDGLGAAELGDLIENAAVFDEARAETIARTETAHVLNASALEQYREFGVTRVQAYDGDDDEECAARDGQIFDIDEAEDIEDHPNGTLTWSPVGGSA